MTYDEFVEIALKLPDVVESTSYGTPAEKYKMNLMFRLWEDGETLVVKLDWDTHDKLLAKKETALFKTPHYDQYPIVLVRLSNLETSLATEMLQLSWESARSTTSARNRI